MNSPSEEAEQDNFALWDEALPPMTKQELENKRRIFWETRVTGRIEMWQILKMSIEAERDSDEETAATIITSAGATPWQAGRSCRFCYDATGERYEVPMYMFEEPRNITEPARHVPLRLSDVDMDISDDDNS